MQSGSGDNNESFGVAVELAICRMNKLDDRGVAAARCGSYNPDDPELQRVIRSTLGDLLPRIVEYLGPDNGDHDFILSDGKTLSVKSNMLRSNKVCPNRSGQPSLSTWLSIFANVYQKHSDTLTGVRNTIRTRTAMMLRIYFADLFNANYTLYVREAKTGFTGYLLDQRAAYRFTQTKVTFSNTTADFRSLSIRYDGVSIGEFQLHERRGGVKFRFNIQNLMRMIAD